MSCGPVFQALNCSLHDVQHLLGLSEDQSLVPLLLPVCKHLCKSARCYEEQCTHSVRAVRHISVSHCFFEIRAQPSVNTSFDTDTALLLTLKLDSFLFPRPRPRRQCHI